MAAQEKQQSAAAAAEPDTYITIDVELCNPMIGPILAIGCVRWQYRATREIAVLAMFQRIVQHSIEFWHKDGLAWWSKPQNMRAFRHLTNEKNPRCTEYEALRDLHLFIAETQRKYAKVVILVDDIHSDMTLLNLALNANHFPMLHQDQRTKHYRPVYVLRDLLRGAMRMWMGSNAPGICELGMYKWLSDQHTELVNQVPTLQHLRPFAVSDEKKKTSLALSSSTNSSSSSSHLQIWMESELIKHKVETTAKHTPVYDALLSVVRFCEMEDLRHYREQTLVDTQNTIRVLNSSFIVHHNQKHVSVMMSVADALPAITRACGLHNSVSSSIAVIADGKPLFPEQDIAALTEAKRNDIVVNKPRKPLRISTLSQTTPQQLKKQALLTHEVISAATQPHKQVPHDQKTIVEQQLSNKKENTKSSKTEQWQTVTRNKKGRTHTKKFISSSFSDDSLTITESESSVSLHK